MKKLLMISVLLLSPLSGFADNNIGVPAKGGQPEYLFIEQVKRDIAQSTAKMISDALAIGRLVIFAQMPKIGDPKLGDKGFTPDVFAEQWQTALEAQLIDITPRQEEILKKLVWAGKLSMDINQDRINTQGIKYKHFLPAKWARETGLFFNAKTGIYTKQPSINYRHPSNAPDANEKQVLSNLVKAGSEAKATGEFGKMGKQAVYRYYDPVKLMAPCLACHGTPKGELDMLGYEKDGMKAGDVIGMISVAIAVKD